MKKLLLVTAILEGMTGIALLLIPSTVAVILLGNTLVDPSALVIARLAGAALITLAFACLAAKNGDSSSLMVKSMLIYNGLSIALLVFTGLVSKLSGRVYGLLSWFMQCC